MPPPGFLPGCFPGQRDSRDIYEVDVGAPGRAGVAGGFRLTYPAACDAGNWARRRYRRGVTAYLHAHAVDGQCRTSEAWVDEDPFGALRFTLFLTVAERPASLAALLRAQAPMAARTPDGRAEWSLGEAGGPGRRLGLRPLEFLSPGEGRAPAPDIYDRWIARNPAGEPEEVLACRKLGDVASPVCEHHSLFDGARMTVTFNRSQLERLREIEAHARWLLRCAMAGMRRSPPVPGR